MYKSISFHTLWSEDKDQNMLVDWKAHSDLAWPLVQPHCLPCPFDSSGTFSSSFPVPSVATYFIEPIHSHPLNLNTNIITSEKPSLKSHVFPEHALVLHGNDITAFHYAFTCEFMWFVNFSSTELFHEGREQVCCAHQCLTQNPSVCVVHVW